MLFSAPPPHPELRAQLSSFKKEGEEEEEHRKLDLNMHVLTALSCGPRGSWSTCGYQAGSAGVH